MPFNQVVGPPQLANGDIEKIGNDLYVRSHAVTYGKMQQVSDDSKLLGSGNTTKGKQDVREINLGTGLSMLGNTLNANVSGQAWMLGGNAPAAGSFLGTTNSVPLQFKRGTNQAGLLGDGLTNAFFGVEAGESITTGSGNAGFGDRAIKGLTTGYSNTALGVDSLLVATSGYQNVSVGYHNMLSTTTGFDNVSVGHDALYNNTTGSYNVAIGRRSMSANIIGNHNTVLGYDALFSSNGSRNVAIGRGAGSLGNYTDRLFIDNQPRGSAANELTRSLIVGTFDSVAANQNITINGSFNLPYLTSNSLPDVLTYDPLTGQVYYAASGGISINKIMAHIAAY